MNTSYATLRRAKRLVDMVRGTDARTFVQVQVPRLELGSPDCSWCICPEGITAKSVVYSVGIGYDASWDIAMIQRFGVTVHAFDPTPISAAWVRAQAFPPGFVFHDWGIAAFDGQAHFVLPEKSIVSFSMTARPTGGEQQAVCAVKTLGATMGELGHDHIDILKLDIEGAEIDVIADLARGGEVPFRQLLVEFHHASREGASQTQRTIGALNRLGLRVFYISANGREYSLIR